MGTHLDGAVRKVLSRKRHSSWAWKIRKHEPWRVRERAFGAEEEYPHILHLLIDYVTSKVRTTMQEGRKSTSDHIRNELSFWLTKKTFKSFVCCSLRVVLWVGFVCSFVFITACRDLNWIYYFVNLLLYIWSPQPNLFLHSPLLGLFLAASSRFT